MMNDKIKILVCEPMATEGIELLKSQHNFEVHVDLGLGHHDLINKINSYQAILVRSQTRVDQALIKAGKELKLIGRLGVGLDNIDVAFAKTCGIAVLNTPSANSTSTAELAMALMLALARKIPSAHQHVCEGMWQRNIFKGVELCHKTLGIIGFGNVGQKLASRAKSFEMKVMAYDPIIDPMVFKQQEVYRATLDQLFLQADFISLHCLLNDDTKEIINQENLAKMKQGVMLINTARGELIDQNHLLQALKLGQVAGAALDVYPKEPPPITDPLFQHENLILTPHIGASTKEAQVRVSTSLAELTIDFFAKVMSKADQVCV